MTEPHGGAGPPEPEPDVLERALRLDWLARRAPRFGRFWHERFTAAGRIFTVVVVVTVSVAESIGIPYPLYYLALLLFCTLVVGRAIGHVIRPRGTIARDLPDRVAAGARVPVRARVKNVGRFPAWALAVTERTRPGIVVAGNLRYLERLGPGEEVERSYTLVVPRRGAWDLDGPVALSAFPFGLLHAVAPTAAPHRLLATPVFTRLAALDLPAGRKHQPGGLALVSEVGDSGELCGSREYRAGDRQRDIHHAAWARLGTPVVREFQQEWLCRVALIADTHLPRGGTPAEHVAFEAAISLGAAVADALARQEYVIDIFAAGPDLYHFQAGRSLAYLDDILDILACVEGTSRNPFETLAPAIAEEISQISTAVLILLDWDAARADFVRALATHGVATKIAIVRDGPPSLDPTGTETAAGPPVVLSPADVVRGIERL